MGEFFKLPHCVFFQHTHINSQRILTGCLTNLTYFFDSIRSHRIRAQSHKTSLLQMTHPIPGCYLSFWPCVYVCMLSHVPLFATLWTVAHQAPLSMGFSRQEYWSGVPCPPLGDLPDPGIEPASLMFPELAGGFFTTSTTDLTVRFYWVWPNFVCVISKIVHTHLHMKRIKIYLKKMRYLFGAYYMSFL